MLQSTDTTELLNNNSNNNHPHQTGRPRSDLAADLCLLSPGAEEAGNVTHVTGHLKGCHWEGDQSRCASDIPGQEKDVTMVQTSEKNDFY